MSKVYQLSITREKNSCYDTSAVFSTLLRAEESRLKLLFHSHCPDSYVNIIECQVDPDPSMDDISRKQFDDWIQHRIDTLKKESITRLSEIELISELKDMNKKCALVEHKKKLKIVSDNDSE